ncbi:hypothetical protein [Actinocorallia libanotica]
MHPLMKAELKWCLFRHARRSNRSHWHLQVIQGVLIECWPFTALEDIDLAAIDRRDHLLTIKGMLRELKIVYSMPEDAREAGYLQFEHFGVIPDRTASELDLTMLQQRWLRDLLWDYFAFMLRSSQKHSSAFFHTLRRACQELGAFLELAEPDRGHDLTTLTRRDVERFVADISLRAQEGLASLGTANGLRPSTMTAVTRKKILDDLHKLFRWVLDQDEHEHRRMNRDFARAFPTGGQTLHRTRSPFTDASAEALAAPDNLARLAETDPADRGMLDIWRLTAATGRRPGEVRELRLDCLGIVNRVPLLWHDQTKVGNYDEAIRIPKYAHQIVLTRRRKTIALFEHRFGRLPTPQERAGWRSSPPTPAIHGASA